MRLDTIDISLSAALARIAIHAGPSDVARFVADIDAAAEAIAVESGVRAVLMLLPDTALYPRSAAVSEHVAFRSLELMPQPVIAVVEGAATGVLFELILACDLRVGGAGASFTLASATEGEVIALGGTQRLPRLIGRARATQMILLGERIDAATAHLWGLVNAVTPRGEAQQRAEEIAASIAARGPLAVRYAKEAIARGLDMSLEQALRYETDLTVILQTTADRAEGVRAFLEKRRPGFEGG